MSEEINSQIAGVPRFRNRQEAIAYMQANLSHLSPQDRQTVGQIINSLGVINATHQVTQNR